MADLYAGDAGVRHGAAVVWNLNGLFDWKKMALYRTNDVDSLALALLLSAVALLLSTIAKIGKAEADCREHYRNDGYAQCSYGNPV